MTVYSNDAIPTNTHEQGPCEPWAVDADVCQRQCVGPGFAKRKDYKQRTEEVLSGVLRLAPHPTWETTTVADWTADPFESRNWQFQHHALRWLSPLRYSIEDGSEEARQFWIGTVRSWIEQNPPGTSPSTFAWMDMADGLRVQEMIFGWPHVKTEEDRQILLSGIHTHGIWLADGAHQSSGNHALHQNIGLFVVSRFFGRYDWQQIALERMTTLFTEAFDEVGANDEGSIQYHQLNLAWWRRAWERVELEGIELPDRARDRLHRAAEFLAHTIRPDGTMTPIGDTHLKTINDEGWDELVHAATQGRTGTPPTSTVAVAPSGYVMGRSGWGDDPQSFARQSQYSIRFGSTYTHHAHHDRGAVTFYGGEQDWATDPGSFIYEPKDPFRQYLKSREAHNLLVITDRSYSPQGAVELERFEVTEAAHDFSLVDDNYDGVALRRRVVYLPGADLLIVVDQFQAQETVTARQLWHVEPGIKPRFRDGAVEMQERSGKRLTLNWLGQWSRPSVSYADDKSTTGWVSRAWGEKSPAAVVETSMTGRKGVCAAVLGVSTEDPWAIESSRVRAQDCWLRVIRFGRVWSIEITSEGVQVTQDEARSHALRRAVSATNHC